MNAAILLVTSAWMTGQAPEIIIPVNHQASAASACGPSCGASCCDDGCSVGHKLRGKLHDLRGRFHRSKDCCEPAPTCNDCGRGGHKLFGGHKSCDSGCDNGCGGPKLLDRLKGMFHRDRGCCGETSCCGTNGGTIHGGTQGGAPAGEPLKEQPKKMPSKDAGKQVNVIPAPQAPIAPAIQNAPAINAAPAIAPRIIETDVRNPF